ncbi:hypothetical protein [Oerskovia jenensis]|uniref:hypothetical protein n=1 Tax=Oerskovia jenensis TaxID=162169 RepID=UPI0036D84BA8
MARWKIPYTAPGSLGGHMIVEAPDVASAVLAAEDLHRGTFRAPKQGPPRQFTLTTKQRLAIEYGEPQRLPDPSDQPRFGADVFEVDRAVI